MRQLAGVLDDGDVAASYRRVCDELLPGFDNPESTFSGRLLEMMKSDGCGGVGLRLAEAYRETLLGEQLDILTEEQLAAESERSWQHQRQLEAEDTVGFDEYLAEQ